MEVSDYAPVLVALLVLKGTINDCSSTLFIQGRE
jgi:hypothetical protein